MTPNNDYAKCKGDGCAYKEQCYRFVRPAGDRQVWQAFDKYASDDCKHYEPIPRDCK